MIGHKARDAPFSRIDLRSSSVKEATKSKQTREHIEFRRPTCIMSAICSYSDGVFTSLQTWSSTINLSTTLFILG